MNLSELKPGQVYSGIVKIVGKRVPGPVVLRVTDGSFTLEAVVRSANVEVGDIVELTGPALRRLGRVQIEVKTITKTDKPIPIPSASAELAEGLVVSTPFNDVSLKPLLAAAALRIKSAILADQPVFLRHHADADGIAGAIVIEKALQDLCKSRGMKPEQYVYRMPSKTPFYDVADALWDASFTRRVLEQRSLPQPLIVVIDNGSTEEDRFALKLLCSMDFSIVVIDHHNPGHIKEGRCCVDPFLDVHVNPLLVGGTYWSTSGMMCYEIAHLINPSVDKKILPAVSAVSDRSESVEAKEYIQKSGLSTDQLKEIALCFDFLSFHLRSDFSTSIFDEILSNPDLVRVIVEDVKLHIEHQLEVILPHAELRRFNTTSLAVVDLSRSLDRFGFPPAGKLTGIVHDRMRLQATGVLMTLGVLPGLIIIRETAPLLPVKRLIEELQKDSPGSHVSGGGHDVAGTVKCLPESTQIIVSLISDKLSKTI